jgi:uncharacterized membrane protein YkvA (DUF1232 family)
MSKKALVKAKETDVQPKGELKDRMKNLLMFLPNLVMLCYNLLIDKRVSVTDKALFAGAIIYAIMPLDFLPDVIPFLGQIDDIYLIALTLLRLINHTDENVVRQYWRGGGDIITLIDSIAGLAPKFLPKRVTRVLTSKVELAPAGKVMQAVTKRDAPLFVEVPTDIEK